MKDFFKLAFVAVFAFVLLTMPLPQITSSAQAEDKQESEDEEQIQKTPYDDLIFVKLKPIMIPIINSRGVTQTVSLVVSIEVDSLRKQDRVKKFEPRLTDAILSDLYGAFSHQSALQYGGVIPIHIVKKRLKKVSKKVLGEETVNDILLQVIQQRGT